MSTKRKSRTAALELVGQLGTFTSAQGNTYNCTVRSVDGDNPPLLVIDYRRRGKLIKGAYISVSDFKP